ncbi:MAG: flagellar filament capping protein FliD [Aliarcobacter cryaerophilus]|nr:flagellar filament capping protein FliD [Aliarcobacter cryaerophilus]
MAEGVLGLGQGQAASLNNDMLEEQKAVDRKATVEPIEAELEKFDAEKEAISNISTKVDEFYDSLQIFSLNQSSGSNAFNQKSVNVMGDGVIFDTDDVDALSTGSMRVQVTQLAQKDVWQSDRFDGTSTTQTSLVDAGKLIINGKEVETDGKTFEEVVSDINKIDGVQASLVEDSTGGFRLSIKSTETGLSSKIDFAGSEQSALDKFGFDNVLKAQDMELTADGVNYSSSSNTVTIDGLKITAVKETGDSTIIIGNDNTNLATQMQNFATSYNNLKDAIENEIYNSESSIDDKSSLRNMHETIKKELFGSGNSNSSIFSYGFSLDEKSGNLVFNTKDFEAAIKDGTKELEALFTGVPEKKGIATLLDEAISVNGVTKSLLDYEINMLEREEQLKKEKEEAETALDTKYELMAQQYASYNVIINEMEASFSGLKMIIGQSQSSN